MTFSYLEYKRSVSLICTHMAGYTASLEFKGHMNIDLESNKFSLPVQRTDINVILAQNESKLVQTLH